jgi:hypothetical protein
MKLKWLINTTAILLLIFVAFVGLASHDSVMAAQDGSSKIESLLLERFTAEGSADFIVRFTEQADLSAAYSMDWNARGEFVYNTLRETAANSQVNAKAILDAGSLKYQTFFIGNELYVWSGNLSVANQLAALPEVYFIRATRTFYVDPTTVDKPLENITWAGDLLATKAQTTVGGSTDAITDWGIIDSKADQFWVAFGVQGEGIKVANIDTGVQWDHPALVDQFACPNDPSNPDCWADPSNICGGSACDNAGHGTHTMGTMVADDDPALTYIAGMAPNAQWIACKGCESSSCSDYALTTCADWILAPGGDPANRPNIVNNSWGGGTRATYKPGQQTEFSLPFLPEIAPAVVVWAPPVIIRNPSPALVTLHPVPTPGLKDHHLSGMTRTPSRISLLHLTVSVQQYQAVAGAVVTAVPPWQVRTQQVQLLCSGRATLT